MATEPSFQRRGVFDPDFTEFAHRALVFPPEALELVGVRDVAARLGMNYQLASQLMVSEWAGKYLGADQTEPLCFRRGSSLMMPSTCLDALGRVPRADEEGLPYLNVRVGPGTRAPAEQQGTRRYLGASGRFQDDDLYLAVTRYWAVTSPGEWIGKLFVASLAGYVVLAGRVTDITTEPPSSAGKYPSTRYAFDVDVSDSEAIERLQGHRIAIHPGATVIKRRGESSPMHNGPHPSSI